MPQVSTLAALGAPGTAAAARERDPAGQAACSALPATARACLLAAAPTAAAWQACGVSPPFRFFDPAAVRERILGAPVTDGPARLAALVGTWRLPRHGKDDAITWTVSPAGALAARRTPIKGAPVDEPPHGLAFVRERQLAMTTGAATQFLPAVVDGDHLYLSWSSGALAHPLTDPAQLVLDLADADQFIVWREPTCARVDPRRGAVPATCAWTADAFVVDGTSWPRHGAAVLHPAMETFERQPSPRR